MKRNKLSQKFLPFHDARQKPSAAAMIICALMIAFQIACAAIWISGDTRLMGNDETDYLQNGLRHKYNLQHNDHDLGSYFTRILGYQKITSTPPLLFDFWEIAWLLFDAGPEAARGFSQFCLALAAVFIFAAARKLGGDIAGLIACATLFCFPPVIAFSRHASSFIPHLAAVSAVCWALIASDLLRKPGYGLLLGLAVSADILLERGTPVIILTPMLIFAALASVLNWRRDKSPANKKALLSIVAAAALILLLCGAYLYGYMKYNYGHTAELAVSPLTDVRQQGYYTKDFFRLSVTHPVAILLAMSLAALLFKKEMGAYRIFFIFAFFIPTRIFANLATRDLEYVLGVLPVGALAVGVGITSIKKMPKAVYAVLLFLIVYFGFALNAYLSFQAQNENSWQHRASRLWELKPQLPANMPNIRRMADIIGGHYRGDELGFLYMVGPLPESFINRDEFRMTLTDMNALQIYLACRKPGSSHVFILHEAATRLFDLPDNTKGIYAAPINKLFGKVKGPADLEFNIDEIEAGLFHYNAEGSEVLAARRFLMTKPTPIEPPLALGARIVAYESNAGRP